MTKQPVLGTIIIGILVVLQSLWILAVSLGWDFVADISLTGAFFATLVALALLLVIIALLPRGSKKAEALRFSPVTEQLAVSGVKSRQQDVVADLRWLDPSSPITIPVSTTGAATIIVNSPGVEIRTDASNVDIGPNMDMTWVRQDGKKNVYVGPGSGEPIISVDVTAPTIRVTSQADIS